MSGNLDTACQMPSLWSLFEPLQPGSACLFVAVAKCKSLSGQEPGAAEGLVEAPRQSGGSKPSEKWLWLKNMNQNGTSVNGTKDEHLRNSSP